MRGASAGRHGTEFRDVSPADLKVAGWPGAAPSPFAAHDRCAIPLYSRAAWPEDAFGERLEALYGALRRMLCVPAPDVGAFCIKAEAMIEHELPTLCDAAASLAAVREDARRLSGGQSI